MTENFNILVNKLNSFKLKYYTFQLLRGIILVISILLVLFMVFSLVEYFVYLSSDIRKILFFGYSFFGFLLLFQFVLIPLLKLFHIIKPLDTKSTSLIIQKNFTEIKDKLLNIIELSVLSETQYSNQIVLASIDQKIEELKIFDFNEAVQFKKLRIIFFYFLISFLTMSVIFLVNRNIFTESTHRIIHYNTQYVKPAPYTFNLVNSNLQAKKGDSYKIQLSCEGNEIPQLVYINIEGNNYLMKTTSAGNFEFEMASVINTVEFYFTDLKYKSEKFLLQLLPKPGITNFSVNINPPAYTNLQSQELNNIGDLQVPTGTKVEWYFSGIDIDSLYLVFNDSVKVNAEKKDNQFYIESRLFNTSKYNIFIQNKITEPELALSYSIDVLPDLFPEINITQVQDSFQLTRYFFKGVIGDDYGFSNLKFHINIDNSDSTFIIPFIKSLIDQDFYYSFDFTQLPQTNQLITYYFSVSDNDVLNNYKTTTSASFTFQFPDRDEIAKTEKEDFNRLENMLQQSQNLTKDIKKDLDNLLLKNMDTNVSDWEKSQIVNSIMNKQNRLEQLYNQIKQDNEKLNNYLNSFNNQSQDILDKQKQIEELLQEVFTDELKELLEEFSKLAEEFNSQKLNQLTRKMDLTYEDLQKQLDRNLEMLRRMKIEEKLQDVIDGVNKLAEEENQLSNQVLNDKNFDEAAEKVKEHQDELNRLENQLNEALELNNELTKPLNFDDFDEDFKDINKSFDENKQELDKNNRKKAGEGLKNSSEKLQNLSFAMNQMLQQNNMRQNMENIQNLKQILSNLIHLSFSQEDVVNQLSGIDPIDPKINQLNQQQKRIVGQSKIVKDSLYALALRTPAITSMVNNELLTVELNLDKSMNEMSDGLFPNAVSSQRFVITSVNNLALMLNEALENLENQLANAQPGDQECENPGDGKPGMNLLKKSAEDIKEQLQQMIEQMKNGNPQQMNQQFGESLIQHEMMQQMLRDIMNNGNVGSGTRDQLQQIDQLLEQNRREIMNRNVNSQTIARQNLITTRLLEAEKAEIEREFEEKRESQSSDEFFSNPLKFFEYKGRENYSIEYINKDSHKLNNFYNNKYKLYLNNIENQ